MGLSGLFWWAPWVDGFVRVRLLRLGAPCVLLGSFGLVCFVGLRSWCRYIRSGSSGWSGCALRVLSGSCASFESVVRVTAFIWIYLARLGVPLGSLSSFVLVRFVLVHPVCCLGLVRPGAYLLSFQFVWFVQMRHGGRWVRSGFFGCVLAVAGFFRVHLVRAGGLWRSLGSIGFVWFVRVLPGCHWILQCLSGSSGLAMGVTGVARVRLVRKGAPFGSLS